MDKAASTAHPIHDLMARRWSPRAFDARSVPPDVLRSVLEAARWAPSSFNAQPWHFIVATKDAPEDFARLLACLVEGNQGWARHAPVLLFSAARLDFERNGKPNRHAWHDVGLATENLMLQATAHGLVTHAMAGYHADVARETLGIPEGFEPVAAIALGYPGDPSRLPDPLRAAEAAPRTRKPLSEIVFEGRWGRALA
ncbi:MAG: nitroreductase family protein [Planctomycetota bacterium]|jgi:nitroreductase